MMTQKQKWDKYGKPGDWSNFIQIELPFPLYVTDAVGKKHKWTKMWCHKKIADNLLAALECILDHYGLERIKELYIDQCGGCVMVRKMRNGTKWSSHAWGIAIDLFPLGNALRQSWEESQFSREEYKPMIDIFYEHNFINYGVEKNYDSMHFEIKN